jgi:dienelactone hydrolase
MKPHPFSVLITARRHGILWRLVLLVAAAVLLVSNLSAAATDAPGVPVTIPGVEIPGMGRVDEVRGYFGRSDASKTKSPAVLILHGSSGPGDREAFYAKALQDAGIATLVITMFLPGGRPPAFRQNMPHAAAALRWLATQPNIDRQRLGVIGFSWGGMISVLMPSDLVWERMGQDVPRPIAFASFYPACSNIARILTNPKAQFYEAHKRMSAAPVLIYVGTLDDTEDGERPCDALAAMWPAAARKHVTVRNVEGATHAFDIPKPAWQYELKGQQVGEREGRIINVIPSPKDAAEAREAVVSFFVKNLNR